MNVRQVERIPPFAKQFGCFRFIALRVAFEYLGSRYRHGGMMVVAVMILAVLVHIHVVAAFQFSLSLQPVLLGMALRFTFFRVDGVSQLGHLVPSRLRRRFVFGSVLVTVIVLVHDRSPVVFPMNPEISLEQKLVIPAYAGMTMQMVHLA